MRNIINFFGEENQKKKAIEELSELIIAVTKNNRKNIIEEIADVSIMVDQLHIIYNIEQHEIDNIRIQKIKRTKNLINKLNTKINHVDKNAKIQ